MGGIDCSEGCNPYGYPKEIEKVLERFRPELFSPYPHSMAAYRGICHYWREQYALQKENILLTDGSISALYIINNIFNIKDTEVVGVAPQFADFTANVKLLGMDYRPLVLKKENHFKICVEEMMNRITDRTGFVYLDNPNNPTGQIVDKKDIERLLERAQEYGVCVVVDEAYGDFMEKENSAVGLLGQYENLIVVRTLSKGFGMAGRKLWRYSYAGGKNGTKSV